MSSQTHQSAVSIRARLGHPVIDTDGHYVELVPVLQRYLVDYAGKAGGSDMVKRLAAAGGPLDGHAESALKWTQLPREQVRDGWLMAPFYGSPALSTDDRAASYLPRLLRRRLDDYGIDYAVLYPTVGLGIGGRYSFADRELRQTMFRAFNSFIADYFREQQDRMTPAAVIPMETPQEAIEELEYAVKVLGLKAAMMSIVMRPIPKLQREHPDLSRVGMRLDTYGIDSDYDYDPLWAKCVELGVAPTFHSGGAGTGSRRSISTSMYNRVGQFAAGGEAVCKSLFYGGVTRRFPSLRCAFLEGGVGWACNLYAEMIGHWKRHALQYWKDCDFDRLMGLISEYGAEDVLSLKDEVKQNLTRRMEIHGKDIPKPPNDFALAGIERAEDFYELFVPRFFFGCEADDAMNALAFDKRINPFGARLGAVLSSDMGHAPDIDKMLPETYELVERGLLTEQDLKDFAFGNAVRLWGEMNPSFFKGTSVEAEAATVPA